MNISLIPGHGTLQGTQRASYLSAASSQSSRSGDGGGKLKHHFSVLSRSLSLDLRRPGTGSHGRDYSGKYSRVDRGSLPTIQDQGTRNKTVPSKKNEEWEFDCFAKPNLSLRHTLSLRPKTILDPSINVARQTRRVRQHATFAESVTIIGHETQELGFNKWYTESEVELFSKDANSRAMAIDRTMKYVAKFEVVTMGLTAPQVLGEYLATPADVVGVEQLLSVQKIVRQSLQVGHIKALLEEQQRNKDPEILAFRLRNSSTIAAKMAQERAEYTLLLQ